MSVVTKILQEPTEKTIAEKIALRAERGRQLYLILRHLITKISTEVYQVPSCTTDEVYTVHYGGRVEDCTCAPTSGSTAARSAASTL